MNLGNPLFSAHSDLLEATVPTDPEGRARLMAECKSRAKAAVGAGQWPTALKLYDKATETTTESNEVAVLQSNRSLCFAKMNQMPQAREAALAASQADPMYVKGWWRLAQAQGALKDAKTAVESLDTALQLEPTNKALQKERTKLQAQAEKEAASNTTSTTTTSSSSTATTTTTTTTKTTTQTKASPPTAKKSTSDDVVTEHADETFKPSEPVRGYKVVNGKKTSYFHHELSEDAAQLIGDIAPKKLAETEIPTAGAADDGKKDRSAWNKAGTWEEKNVTEWGEETLKAKLLEATFTLPDSSPAPGAVLTVTDATCAGHASVATVRGKKRYLYEWSVTVTWAFKHNDNTASGQLEFPDVDGTCVVGEPYDAAHFVVKDATDEMLRPVLDTFCHRSGLRDSLHTALDDWVRLLQASY